MVVIEVYSQSLEVKCKNSILSKAAFLKVVTRIVNLIIPFIIVYKSGGFLLNHVEFYEQPKIYLQGDYLLIAVTRNSDPIVCSTVPFYNTHMKNVDLCSLIKVREIDLDLDNKNDQLDFRVRISLDKREFTSINVFLPIELHFQNECPLRIQSTITFQEHLRDPATSLKLMGDLNLFQSNVLHCNRIDEKPIQTEPNINDFEFSDDYELDRIMERYLNQNITTHIINKYVYIKKENKDAFDLQLSVHYPELRIYYKPSFWRIAKQAWIQYIAIFIITNCLTKRINDYIFRRRLVLYYEDSPLKKDF